MWPVLAALGSVLDQAAWNKLADLGCDVAQGYLISRPMPAAGFTSWLELSPWGLDPTGFDRAA